MKRNLQGIALILFAILLAITFHILGYDTIFDLDLEWSHIFILLGLVGLILNYVRPKVPDEDQVVEPVREIKKDKESRSWFKPVLVIVLVVVIVLGVVINHAYNLYREENYVESFADECSVIVSEHEANIISSPDDYEFVTYYKVGDTGYGYMLDENLDILLHPNTDVIGKNVNDFIPHILEDAKDKLVVGASQLVMYEFNGVEKMIYIYKDSKENYLCIVADLKYY
ncbi:hypothetical protein EZV73_01465 [Acidaminobacter sp. JC074]|uniref:hypothetical protein n=1 Tax=Acidaminobacter sp. JC074 TaxID=2530199 RepID=UPI001F116DD1|nr:hypothetical protein [Acidaminobacter sp. JC074]MCH4886212.1 hypothetical protein [Acidaminobacter sp. JC074]